MKLQVTLRRREAQDDPHLNSAGSGRYLVVSRAPSPTPTQMYLISWASLPMSSPGSQRSCRYRASLSSHLPCPHFCLQPLLLCFWPGVCSPSLICLQHCWLTPAIPQESCPRSRAASGTDLVCLVCSKILKPSHTAEQ